MLYSDIISVSESFKNSVNIEYDLHSDNKIAEYIPTEDVCEILRYYFNAVNDPKNIRSTIVEGPYGKGKSYLVLSLLHLMMLDDKNEHVLSFLDKLKIVDVNLYNQYIDLKKRSIRLLPVIINSNYHRLPQALNMALKEALSNIGLNKLFPNTAYEICLDVIAKWKKNEGSSEYLITTCFEKTGISLDELEKGIREYDMESFDKFVRLYNCIVNGLEFNPFASDDVVKNYKDIAHELGKYGYTGLFIVFDEFSKFIEAENDNLSQDLRVLQDLAEASNRSGKMEQLHLCCITHKALNSYYKNKKETTANAFKTVEGRFKEIRFNRSMNQNYRIISLTLKKNDGFNNAFNKFYKQNAAFYNKTENLELLNGVDRDLISKGCFPLNPLTTYSVIHVAEKIAQNERTLFTFISDNDSNSLNSFIRNNGTGLFNVDKIYDYFANLLEKSEDDSFRKISYKTQVCLSKLTDNFERSIVKTLAVIKLIDDDAFSPSLEMISACLMATEQEVLAKLNVLCDANILKKSFSTEYYDFALASSKTIDKKVEAFIATKAKKENISAILNVIFDNVFVLPRKYNATHKMTRFYRELYITDNELMSLTSFDSYYDKYFADGFIFRVLNTGNSTTIKAHYDSISNNQRVILKNTDKSISDSIVNEILRISALQMILADKQLENDVKDETRLIVSDEINELKYVLEDMFSTPDICSFYEASRFNELTSIIFEREFNRTPVINLEMMNKESELTPQYAKPRATVVNMYISGNLELITQYSETSPEATVYNAVKETETTEKRTVLDHIKGALKSSEEEKISAVEVIEPLKKAPFGLRNGILPLMIAMAVYEMNDNIILYFDKREIDLNADNIVKVVENPERYSFAVFEGSQEKDDYISEVMGIFNVPNKNSYRENVKASVESIQKWFRGLPRLVVNCSKRNNYLELDSKFLEIKSIFTSFNINEHETLMYKLPKLFGSYKNTVKALKNFKKSANAIVNDYTCSIAQQIKTILNENSDGSLYNVFTNWIATVNAKGRVLEDKEKELISVFDIANYDDNSVVNSIAVVLTKLQVTDWSNDDKKTILDFIQKLVDNISEKALINDIVGDNQSTTVTQMENVEISAIGRLLMNNIDEAFEEFGDSVSNEEKIAIMMKYLNSLTK